MVKCLNQLLKIAIANCDGRSLFIIVIGAFGLSQNSCMGDNLKLVNALLTILRA
ncbi:hypothetical protein [Calothrix rhizosoleniae]|uniref:hypothetical protein n=1 Tax=Calothrix rhizosoleniae TaxID=888997 RepID=UPI0013564111|nr:hypothetical protein [Calothrix rhizosoleniae]